VRQAGEFCRVLEDVTAGRRRAYVRRILRSAVRLHVAVLAAHAQAPLLEPLEADRPDIGCRQYCPLDEERRMSLALHSVFATRDSYLSNMRADEPETGECSISVDLADTYGDLKEAMGIADSPQPNALRDAIAVMLEDYRYHWGNHLVNVVRALHGLDVRH